MATDDRDTAAFEAPFPKIVIPELFFSDKTGRPFARCSGCGGNVVDDVHMVGKVLGLSGGAYEYCFCGRCLGDIRFEMSELTMQRLDKHFSTIDTDLRFEKLIGLNIEPFEPWLNGEPDNVINIDTIDLELWVDDCVMCGNNWNDCKTRHVAGACDGPHLFLNSLPQMICDECEEKAQNLCSKETLGYMDDLEKRFYTPSDSVDADSPRHVPLLV